MLVKDTIFKGPVTVADLLTMVAKYPDAHILHGELIDWREETTEEAEAREALKYQQERWREHTLRAYRELFK